MREQAQESSSAQLRRQSATAALVRDVNAAGVTLLIDLSHRMLCAWPRERLTPELIRRVGLDVSAVVEFLATEATEGGQ